MYIFLINRSNLIRNCRYHVGHDLGSYRLASTAMARKDTSYRLIYINISVAHDPYPITAGANTLTRIQALQPFRAANNTFQRIMDNHQQHRL